MTYILTAFTGLLTGGCTVVLLYLLLLYPQKPVRVGPFKWVGLISYWFDQSFPKMLMDGLYAMHPSDRIKAQLVKPETKEQAATWLLEQVNRYLSVTVPEKWPMLSLLIGDKTHDKIQKAISEHLQDNWDGMVDSLCRQQLSDEQIAALVRSTLFEQQIDAIKELAREKAKKYMIRIAPFLLLFSVLIAILGRMIYLTLPTF